MSVGRTYTSGGLVWGEGGWGWDVAGVAKLRPLPDGTVELPAGTTLDQLRRVGRSIRSSMPSVGWSSILSGVALG